HIAIDQITNALMADDAIDSAEIADGAVDFVHIQDVAANSILGRNASSSGVLSEVALATTQILIGDGTGFTAAAISGNATMTNAGVLSIAAAAITGQSELAATTAVADMYLVYDASATALKKISARTLGQTWTAATGNVTAVTGDNYLCDSSGGAFAVTLPSSPVIGNMVRIVDGKGAAATNNITVGRGGENIQGAASDLVIATNRAAIGLVFYNSANGWVLVEN
ncbi:uncharacterized protein METZ01_LOCUS377934, partial [marine metagenome]